MSGRFHITAGPREGEEFDVPPGGAVLLGRGSQSTVSLHDNTVSKVHCKLYEKDGWYYMEDLKSRNGVLVNKARVARCRLAAGDVIQLGRTKIEFRIGGETDIQTAIRPAVAVAETRATPPIELARTDERPPLKEELKEDSAEHFLEEEPSRRQTDAIFGRIALLNRMVTQGQLDECVAAQEASPDHPKRPLGEFLVEKGYLSPTQRDLLLQIQVGDEGERERDFESRKKEYIFAKLAIKKGYLQEKQVLECIRLLRECEKEGLSMQLDELLEKKGYLSRAQRQDIFKQQSHEGFGHKIEGYEILEMIGHGGMGAVYKARQVSMDRVVAIKILSEKYKERSEYVERFLQEARTVAKLNHENIIAGIDFGKVGDLSYFVMEYVAGPTVLDLLRDQKRIPPMRALDIVIQVARALEHAQKKGLVHQDIKPDNIMIGEGDVVKLCDLGLAKKMEVESGGRTIGTANYMSPEQIMGSRDVDIRGDIYSLGVTFYRMLFARLPFKGASPAVIMSKHLNEPVQFPAEPAEPPIPQLLPVLDKMMAKRREDRYQSAKELLDLLEGIRETLLSGSSRPAVVAEEEEEDGGGEPGGVETTRNVKRRRRRPRRRRF